MVVATLLMSNHHAAHRCSTAAAVHIPAPATVHIHHPPPQHLQPLLAEPPVGCGDHSSLQRHPYAACNPAVLLVLVQAPWCWASCPAARGSTTACQVSRHPCSSASCYPRWPPCKLHHQGNTVHLRCCCLNHHSCLPACDGGPATHHACWACTTPTCSVRHKAAFESISTSPIRKSS
jgi:hypothetical protein